MYHFTEAQDQLAQRFSSYFKTYGLKGCGHWKIRPADDDQSVKIIIDSNTQQGYLLLEKLRVQLAEIAQITATLIGTIDNEKENDTSLQFVCDSLDSAQLICELMTGINVSKDKQAVKGNNVQPFLWSPQNNQFAQPKTLVLNPKKLIAEKFNKFFETAENTGCAGWNIEVINSQPDVVIKIWSNTSIGLFALEKIQTNIQAILNLTALLAVKKENTAFQELIFSCQTSEEADQCLYIMKFYFNQAFNIKLQQKFLDEPVISIEKLPNEKKNLFNLKNNEKIQMILVEDNISLSCKTKYCFEYRTLNQIFSNLKNLEVRVELTEENIEDRNLTLIVSMSGEKNEQKIRILEVVLQGLLQYSSHLINPNCLFKEKNNAIDEENKKYMSFCNKLMKEIERINNPENQEIIDEKENNNLLKNDSELNKKRKSSPRSPRFFEDQNNQNVKEENNNNIFQNNDEQKENKDKENINSGNKKLCITQSNNGPR